MINIWTVRVSSGEEEGGRLGQLSKETTLQLVRD